MYEKKFDITREDTLFWAKRNYVEYIWNAANLEGIPFSFPQIQTICEGVSIPGKKIEEINRIIELAKSWSSMLESLNSDINDSSEFQTIFTADCNWIEKALNLCVFLLEKPMDDKKSIWGAFLLANKVLIDHGCGILTVGQCDANEFFSLLHRKDKEMLKQFLYSHLDGFRKLPVK